MRPQRFLKLLSFASILVFAYQFLMLLTTPRSPVKNNQFVVASQDDPLLVDSVLLHLNPPALSDKTYNLSDANKTHYSQFGQSQYADRLFKKKRGGFFIEVGAANGEELSNSLFFEKSRGWQGLLIEPNPKYFEELSRKNRKAYTINAGLSLTPASHYAMFKPNLSLGRIVTTGSNLITIKTFPLYTMLVALNVSHIDFFSLDVEGDELKVLKTIPWDKVTVKVICVETNHLEEGSFAVVQYLLKQGFSFIGRRDVDIWFVHTASMKDI